VHGQSPWAAECRGARVPGGYFKNNNFPVTVKIRTSGYQASNHSSQLFMLRGRLVHVGETFKRFADFAL